MTELYNCVRGMSEMNERTVHNLSKLQSWKGSLDQSWTVVPEEGKAVGHSAETI